MTNETAQLNTKRLVSAWLDLLAGVWGIVASLIWIANQFGMNSAGTPLSVIIKLGGPGLVFLMLHLALFAGVALSSLRALIAKPLDKSWLRVLFVFSVVYTGLSLLPSSTVGFFMLPGAVGSLVSSLLLLRDK